MQNLRKTFPLSDAFTLVVSAVGAIALAWIVRGRAAASILGTDFDVRSLAVRMAFLAALAAVFFIYISAITAAVNSSSRPVLFLALNGAVTGVFTFFFVYGPGTLDGTHVDWLLNIGDNAQHYLAWVFYRHDPWAFPPTFTQSLGYPFGISVSFADPVPLLIVPLKLLRAVLPEPYQYFGLWTLLCFVLQGGLAALILHETTNSRLAALLAPAFFCLATIFLYRIYVHIALEGQWTVLLALYLFFRGRRDPRALRWWPLALVLAVLVHPYFLGIDFLVFLAALGEDLLTYRRWKPAMFSLFGSVAAVLAVMWLTGLFAEGYSMSAQGVDYFKANLNSLVNPVNSGWSVFLQPLPLTAGTYPTVHYLGLGMILLACLSLWLSVQKDAWKGKWQTIRAWILPALLVVLLLLSLGNVVTLNEKILFTYNLPEPFLKIWGVFRATERFLWPVFYIIFILSLTWAMKLIGNRRLAALVLLAALTVQYLDIAPLLEEKYRQFSNPQGTESPYRSQFWDDAAGQFRSVVMLPLNLRNWIRQAEYAAVHGLTINYIYFGRENDRMLAGAEEKIGELAEGRFTEGDLYILEDMPTVRKACGLIRAGQPFAFADGEFVLAPGFSGDLASYPDIAVTGANFDCQTASLTAFLEKYRQQMVVLSVKEDASAVLNSTSAALRAAGFSMDQLDREGVSFIGVSYEGRARFEQAGEKRIDLEVQAGESLGGLTWPAGLRVSSAGRISGEEISEIVVGEKDYSFNRPGLNACAFDVETGKPLSCTLFEMRQ